MNKNILLQESKKYKNNPEYPDRKELMRFVRQQFQLLMKKNLRVPVKLYHL